VSGRDRRAAEGDSVPHALSRRVSVVRAQRDRRALGGRGVGERDESYMRCRRIATTVLSWSRVRGQTRASKTALLA